MTTDSLNSSRSLSSAGFRTNITRALFVFSGFIGGYLTSWKEVIPILVTKTKTAGIKSHLVEKTLYNSMVQQPHKQLGDTEAPHLSTLSYLPQGEWIQDKNKTFAAPVCCGWDSRQYLQNPALCGTTALSEHEMIGRKDFLAQTGGNGCTCSARGFQDNYSWSGISETWDANWTCHKLGGRKVLMLGDSTMGQTAAILMNALFPSGCQTQFTYSVCDTLVNQPMGNYNRGEEWTKYVDKYKPDIVILSAGPHIYNRSNFEIVISNVIEETKRLKETNPELEVVWKTQQPGGCTEEITKEIKLSHNYQYGEFYERDLYALAILPANNIHVIDMRMLYYRSDAHVNNPDDCMHLCVPGPLDIIAPLFSHLLDKIPIK
jgi:hypothetical protein